MSSPALALERAIDAFRREHGLAYLRRLAAQPSALQRDAPVPRALARFDRPARSFLTSERGSELLDEALSSGELAPAEHAAVLAHVARAFFEQHYQPARRHFLGLLEREVSVEGDTRSIGELVGQWSGQTNPGQRERTLSAMGPTLEQYAEELLAVRADSDAALGTLLMRLKPSRHADAGPEGGSTALAEEWLTQTEALAQEAFAFARRALGVEGQGGFDALWIALGQDLRGLFSSEGRLRRLAIEWEPLGLRRLLTARGRAGAAHPGPWAAAQLVVVAPPEDVRISPSAREYGLASELGMVEAIGRAVSLVHGSSALRTGLRVPSVGTVARGIGSLAVQRFTDTRFLRQRRGLSIRESELVARLSALYFLLDSRLAAASVLTRNVRGDAALDQIAPSVERALLGSVQRGPAAALVLRASPSAALRGKVHGPALSWAMREQFDEDWYLNPKAGEPLRGAMARAGELSIESFATELSTNLNLGVEKLSELF
ncbi:MAG: Chromosome partition protein smc [Myxococcaceae bacterium]|nr:Chromosome partition protein smc [Myxococcaceae bacterium]